MNNKFLLLFFIVSLSVFSQSSAQNYAVALKASTTGISVEGLRSFGEDFNAHIGFAAFTFNKSGGGGSGDDYKFDAKLKLLSFSALADWFPFDFDLRITGGAFINLNKGDVTLTPVKTYQVGGTAYTPEILGSLSANVDVDRISPYLGVGFGNRLVTKGLQFTCDIGALYQNTPSVTLSAKGLLSPSAEQSQIVADNISWFKFYPVISIGLLYTF